MRGVFMLAALGLASAATGAPLPEVSASLVPGRRRCPRPPAGPDTVPCPRCRAATGESCDRRTLGRHEHHMARVEALKATRGGAG